MNRLVRISVRPFCDFMSAIGRLGIWFTIPMNGKYRLSFFSKRKYIDQNYDKNLLAIEHHLDKIEKDKGFIENQKLYNDMYYGVTTMAETGCEVIAVYNALVALLLNESGSAGAPSLPKLISIFENSGIMMAGQFGTGPKAIVDFFRKRGIEVRIAYDQSRYGIISRERAASIIMIFNNKDRLHDAIHTMCITRDRDYLVLHNLKDRPVRFSSMKELIAKSGVKGKAQGIMIVGIGDKINKI